MYCRISGGGDLRLTPQGFRGFFKYFVSSQAARLGFTLAEVLITLGIIGVVAALTIPTLISNYQKQVWINQLKKTYSVLNEGYKQIMYNEGCTDMKCTGFMDSDSTLYFDNQEAKNKFVNTFKLSNVNNSSILDYEVKKTSGFCNSDNVIFSSCITAGGDDSILGTTADGTIIVIGRSIVGGLVFVDTNGSRGPNEFGRDIFVFVYTDKIIAPYFSRAHMDLLSSFGTITISEEERKQGVEQNCNENSRMTCAEKIIMDGWQMNY